MKKLSRRGALGWGSEAPRDCPPGGEQRWLEVRPGHPGLGDPEPQGHPDLLSPLAARGAREKGAALPPREGFPRDNPSMRGTVGATETPIPASHPPARGCSAASSPSRTHAGRLPRQSYGKGDALLSRPIRKAPIRHPKKVPAGGWRGWDGGKGPGGRGGLSALQHSGREDSHSLD